MGGWCTISWSATVVYNAIRFELHGGGLRRREKGSGINQIIVNEKECWVSGQCYNGIFIFLEITGGVGAMLEFTKLG
jgi:hypothetical protein